VGTANKGVEESGMTRLAVWLPMIALALQGSLTPARAAEAPAVRTMNVTAIAEVRAVPDRAVLQLGVETEGSNAQTAMAQNNALMSQVVQALRQVGIPESNLQTSYITLSPVYSNPPPRDPPTPPQLIGFRASNVLAAELTDLTKVGPAIDAGVTAGANQLQGISFRLADEQPYRLQALRAAGARARAKADALAAGLGVTISYVESASEAEFQVVPVERGAAPAADGASTPVLPGEVIVRAQVQVRFAVQ
jgi:uncharacterized protein YggE